LATKFLYFALGNQSSAPSNSNHNASDDADAGENTMFLPLALIIGMSLTFDQ
jgi:hypothetical protein